MGWKLFCFCLSSKTRERENYGEINVKSKQQKQNDGIDLNVIQAAVGVQTEESPAFILKLNAICCDDLFDWLSLKDLHSLGQTCKRMHRLTGLYFQENFKQTIICGDQSIYHRDTNHNKIQLNGFIEFVQNIKISGFKIKKFQYIKSNCKTLRKITFGRGKLTKHMINLIKEKLNKVEVLQLNGTNLKPNNLYNDLIAFGPNLKEVIVYKENVNEEFCVSYPKLDHLILRYEPQTIDQNIRIFFQQNPQLQRLDCEYLFLLGNSETIINSMMELDILTIKVENMHEDELNELCKLLNKLYDNNFYKRVEIIWLTGSQHYINLISKLRRLEKLDVFFYEDNIVFPSKILSLKEICIYRNTSFVHNNNIVFIQLFYSAMADAFPNLCVVHIFEPQDVDALIPLIQRLPKLKEIYMRWFDRSSNGIQIDLSILNEEREKLSRACKLTINLPEKSYLATKMAPKNLYINHDLIEIKRDSVGDSWIFKIQN